MENLSPFQVFSKFKDNQLDISSAINILASFIENSDSIIIRAESLKNLGRILSENELTNRNNFFQIIENCATSDESPQVRNIAVGLIVKYFSEKSEDLLKYIVQNEKSVLIVRNLINFFGASKEIKSSLKNELRYRLYDIFGTKLEEAKFFLDLHILNPHTIIDNEIPEEFYKEGIVHSKNKILQPNDFSRYVVRKGHVRLLNLQGCTLYRIPKSIKNLSRLNYLDLGNNKLRSFPKSILSLMKLKKVKLDTNKLKRFSKSAFLFAKQNLAQKYISEGVALEEAPVLGLFEMLTGYKLENVKTLVPDLTSLHESAKHFELNEAGHVIKLTIIPYEDFYFKFIPHQISRLVYLEELEFLYNTIKYLPDTLGTLKHLRKLDLRGNKIRELPQSIGDLSSLEYVLLGWNNIQIIPESILQLNSLKEIFIGAKKISSKVKAFFDSNERYQYSIE